MQHFPSGVSGTGHLEGHLELKLKRWKCYFVKLTGRQLLLYHDFNATPMPIYIQENATCKMGKSKRNNYQFSLHMGKATHHFRAPSELHRATWMMHMLEATRAVSPKRQPSQRSLYSLSSLSSINSFSRYPDEFFIGAPSEYVQFCRRSRPSRSSDSSPVNPDLGARNRFTRRSLADCHLPLNNMRWYESAPSTPLPLSEEELDPDIISLPDVSSDLLSRQRPKQLLQRTGGVNHLENLEASKFKDLSSLDFAGDSDSSSHLDTMDTFASFLQWPYYDMTSLDHINTCIEPPKFHRSASLPHSLSHLSRDTTAPLQWVHTRTYPVLSVLSEKHTPDISPPNRTPQNLHLSLQRDHSLLDTTLPPLTMWSGNMELYVPPDTNGLDQFPINGSVGCATPGYTNLELNTPPVPHEPHDYENISSPPPELPARTRSSHGSLIEVSKHMVISEPELFPLPPLPGLSRSLLRSITRQGAEELLSGTAVGTFLVRFRESSPDKLALSIQMECGVRHHRVLSDTSGALSIEGFNCRESSLESLLRSLIRARNGKLTLLCPEEPLSDEDTHKWESNNSLDFIL